jgi:hypothetical protein
MSKFSNRMNGLFKRTHRFVPISAYRLVAESFRIRLEEAEKRPGLKRRLAELERLVKKHERTKDPELDSRIKATFDNDQEVWAAHCLPFWEAQSNRTVLGDWLEEQIASKILDAARRAKDELEWKKKQDAKVSDAMSASFSPRAGRVCDDGPEQDLFG